MTTPPSAVLSDHFTTLMQGKRLVSAVFTTFRFEPQFFETQILPVFLDVPLSHSTPIKLVQLEDALRALRGSIAVYYDHRGLVGQASSPRLDIRRIPMRHRAIFHPKNVFALVEDIGDDGNERGIRTLLCGCASANLTQAGWWENVEVAHVEAIREGDRTCRDDLRGYVNALLRLARGGRPADEDRHLHTALEDIRAFLDTVEQPANRSVQGRLHTRLHFGTSSLVGFLAGVAGSELNGLNLEIISPYFDETPPSRVVEEISKTFAPKEIRLHLPKDAQGAALCPEALHSWIAGYATWSTLEGKLMQSGRSEQATRRTVHAKVYRFFDPRRGGREFVYAGSSNLTTPGCLEHGNWESGFFVETTDGGKPDWWLQPEVRAPGAFSPRHEEEASSCSGGTALDVRFDWVQRKGGVRWTAANASPRLEVRHNGVVLFEVAVLVGNAWSDLDESESGRLEETLRSTSLLDVAGEAAEPAKLLVQEDGMASRPSLLLDLSLADILKAWSLLSAAQRAEFISQRATLPDEEADPLLAKLPPLIANDTLFDRFAGIFHAFGCLDARVREAFAKSRPREADYLVFGEKYDSLGSLIRRVSEDARTDDGKRAEHYVVMLSARQFLDELARERPDYWAANQAQVARLDELLEGMQPVREALAQQAGMPAFLDWFDRWFLVRAQPPVAVDG